MGRIPDLSRPSVFDSRYGNSRIRPRAGAAFPSSAPRDEAIARLLWGDAMAPARGERMAGSYLDRTPATMLPRPSETEGRLRTLPMAACLRGTEEFPQRWPITFPGGGKPIPPPGPAGALLLRRPQGTTPHSTKCPP